MTAARLLIALVPLLGPVAAPSSPGPYALRTPGLPSPTIGLTGVPASQVRARPERTDGQGSGPTGPSPLLDSPPDELTDDERPGESLAGLVQPPPASNLAPEPAGTRAVLGPCLPAPAGSPPGCPMLRC